MPYSVMWYVFNAWKNKRRDTCESEEEQGRARDRAGSSLLYQVLSEARGRDPRSPGVHRLPQTARVCLTGFQLGQRFFWRCLRPSECEKQGSRAPGRAPSWPPLCVCPGLASTLPWLLALAPARPERSAPGAAVPGGSERGARGWSHLHCSHVDARSWWPRTSPASKQGGTLQLAMKSWQLIAVVGDALQVRRSREAPSALPRDAERGGVLRGFPGGDCGGDGGGRQGEEYVN